MTPLANDDVRRVPPQVRKPGRPRKNGWKTVQVRILEDMHRKISAISDATGEPCADVLVRLAGWRIDREFAKVVGSQS